MYNTYFCHMYGRVKNLLHHVLFIFNVRNTLRYKKNVPLTHIFLPYYHNSRVAKPRLDIKYQKINYRIESNQSF